jgi:hypothetical protein
MPSPNDVNTPFREKLEDLCRNISDEITAWLGRLVLLYGVPLSYLVPEEAMLPRESIRFFYLDPIWIQSLVQGACSVGTNGYGDTLVDRAMNTTVQPNRPASDGQPGLAGKAALGVRDQLRHQYEGVELPKQSGDLEWPLTGFLLRSAVVEGWRGLEVMAYQMNAAEKAKWERKELSWKERLKLREGFPSLKALRIEQLAPDVMLGIFNGIIGQLVIRQPQEGLHFGLTPEKGSYSKTLRELGNANPAKAGQNLPPVITLSENGLMRDPKGKRVVDIASLADRMKKKLGDLKQLGKEELSGKEMFTSAEFAVEMIEVAGEYTFIMTGWPDGHGQ